MARESGPIAVDQPLADRQFLIHFGDLPRQKRGQDIRQIRLGTQTLHIPMAIELPLETPIRAGGHPMQNCLLQPVHERFIGRNHRTALAAGDVLGGVEREDCSVRKSARTMSVQPSLEAMCAILDDRDVVADP